MATIKITERTPQAFVGSISFGTQEEGDSNASGTFSAPICPHKLSTCSAPTMARPRRLLPVA